MMRVLVSMTSMGRSSMGGSAFLIGLIEGLRLQPMTEVAVVGPPHVRSVLAAHCIDVRVAARQAGVGGRRVLSDLVGLGGIASSVAADVLIVPHEYAVMSSVPVVSVIQNIGFLHSASAERTGAKGQMLRGLARITLPRAKGIVYPSRVAMDALLRVVPAAPQGEVIPHGFLEEAPSRRRPRTFDRAGVVFVTGSGFHKNADLVKSWLRAGFARSWSDVTIIGLEGPSSANTTFVSRMPRSQLLSHFRRAEIVVIPSIVESFGLAALEALVEGAKVVVLQGTAMAEWLGGQVYETHNQASDLETSMRRAQAQVDGCPQRDDLSRFHLRSVGRRYRSYLESVVA